MDSLGSFADCIVDSDAESLRGERKLRGIGFAISVTVQLAILIVLILVPILTPAMLPKLLSVVQVPAYLPPAIVRDQPITRARTVTQPAYIPNDTSRITATVGHPTSNSQPIGQGVILDFGEDYKPPDLLDVAPRPGVPPPPPTVTRAPLKVGSGVMEALLINRVEPKYPRIAQAARVSGAVVLSAVIAADGTIQSVHVVSGPPLLMGAALDAVRQWRYKPTLLDDEPVEVQTLITVNFVLQ